MITKMSEGGEDWKRKYLCMWEKQRQETDGVRFEEGEEPGFCQNDIEIWSTKLVLNQLVDCHFQYLKSVT